MRLRSIAILLAVVVQTVLMVPPALADHVLNIWPLHTRGSPVFEPGSALGYFIWTDHGGIHVRWTTRGATRRFSGSVTTEGTITQFRRIQIERAETVRRTNDTITWDARNTGFTDGFDFDLSRSADWIRFSLRIDGRPATPDQIFLGVRGAHPVGSPFAIFRAGEPSGWPAFARGEPGFQVGGDLGYFIWHNDDGWHVRWTTRGRTRVFSGTVTTNGQFHDVRRVRMEGGDLTLRGDTVIAWVSSNTGGLDGYDFRTSGDRLTFTLLLDAGAVSVNQIFIGVGEAHPSSNPFTLTR